MANLQLKDIVNGGLQLTKTEAQLLLPHILKISKHGDLTIPTVCVFESTILTGAFSKVPNLTL